MSHKIKYQQLLFLIAYIAFYISMSIGIGNWTKNILYISFGIAGLWLFRHDWLGGIKSLSEKRSECLFWILGGFVTNIVLTALFSMPATYIIPDYNGMNAVDQYEAIRNMPKPIILLIFGVMGPITEELIYRVLPFKLCKSVCSKVRSNYSEEVVSAIYVIFTALVFMSIHMHALNVQELLYNLSIIATGLVYGFIMMKTENPILTTVMHMTNNIIGTLGLMANL